LACRVWREADPDDARLLEAALALELTTGAMDEATAAMKSNAAG
jgi:hypothetical protein